MAGDQQNGSKHEQYTGNDFTGGQDDAASAEQSNGTSAEIEQRIQEAVSQALAEQRDTVLRAHAEVQNMRRRCEADVEKAHKFALEKFSAELLSVVDNLERALTADPGHGCTGRSAPARLERALSAGRALGLELPELGRIAAARARGERLTHGGSRRGESRAGGWGSRRTRAEGAVAR